MPTICPNCGDEFAENKVICPACGTTHPDALATDEAETQSVQREDSTHKYLQRMKTVNYAVAVLIGGLGGLSLLLQFLGLAGLGIVIGGSASGEYSVPSGVLQYVFRTAPIVSSSVLGTIISMAVGFIVLVTLVGLFIGLGYSISHGYQLGLAANLLLYLGYPLFLGVRYGEPLVALVVLFFLPTTYWPLLGREGINFEPSLSEEAKILFPELIQEYGRLINIYQDTKHDSL